MVRFLAAFLGFFTVLSSHSIGWSGSHYYDITIQNHQFEPAELIVPCNSRIKLNIHNLDPTAEEFESNDLRREKIIAGNSSTIISFGPLSTGSYSFFGEFHPETAQGRVIVQ